MKTDKNLSLYLVIATWILRVLCGGLFIFSGFVKAIDPWGTIFKFEEYFAALGLDSPFAILRLAVFFLCALEFVVGLFLATGCFRKSCPVVALGIMCVFLPLTLWIAIENPVADCGCFGDAWHLSNWATFLKNVILTAGIVWLIFFNLRGICLITPAFQWLAVLASGIFILVIELIGFYWQPLLDFRNFPVGSPLFSQTEDEEEPNYIFKYEKNGEIKGFTIENLPDESEGWKFVGRENLSSTSTENSEKGLNVFDRYSMDEANPDAEEPVGEELVVMIPNVSMVSPATTWKLNSLYEWSVLHDVMMIAIVSGSQEEIDEWEDLSMASYPIFVADDTSIKEVVRGNPGIVFLKDGKILWKTNLSAMDVDGFTGDENSDVVDSIEGNNARYLINIVVVYLIFMAFLVFISFTPRMIRLMTAGGLASKRGVRHH